MNTDNQTMPLGSYFLMKVLVNLRFYGYPETEHDENFIVKQTIQDGLDDGIEASEQFVKGIVAKEIFMMERCGSEEKWMSYSSDMLELYGEKA